MKNKDKIIILKARIIELERELKKAERTCAEQDNEIDEFNLIINARPTPTKYDDLIESLQKTCNIINDAFKPLTIGIDFSNGSDETVTSKVFKDEKGNIVSQPIESTQELFEGKGVIKTLDSLYFKEVNDGGYCSYTKDIKAAALFNNFEHFREQTKKPHWEAHPDNFTFIPINK